MEEVYKIKDEKKFIKTFDMSDYEILTDDGFKDLISLHETIPYEVWRLKLSNGYELECADDHIVFDHNMNEVFVKDLETGDKIKTDDGNAIVISIENTKNIENMYDFELSENSNRRYFTNGILSHNTELAKQIAKYMFDSEDALLRLDMSEYMEKHQVSRIQGSAPGYVGYDDSNFLDKVRRKPYSVILFDEIEKAHPEVFNLFLQVFDDGVMTDAHGRKVSFKNTIILMSSNVGTKVVKDFGGGIGFSTKATELSKSERIKGTLDKEMKKKFAPEFINRLDDVIYFNDLSKDDILKIVDIELSKTLQRAIKIGYEIHITDKLKSYITEVGYSKEYGARPLKRTIQRLIDDEVTEYIINNTKKTKSITKLKLDFNEEDESVVVSKMRKTKSKSKDGKN